MKKAEKYVRAQVEKLQQDVRLIDGTQWIPVSDAKAHIAFAVMEAQKDAIDESVALCSEMAQTETTSTGIRVNKQSILDCAAELKSKL